MRHYRLGQGKWVFVDWMGIDPGYGTAWGGAISEGTCVPERVERKVHGPRLEPEFAIPLDRPWETGMSAYATFMEDDGGYIRIHVTERCSAGTGCLFHPHLVGATHASPLPRSGGPRPSFTLVACHRAASW